jgi:hypothetical protein
LRGLFIVPLPRISAICSAESISVGWCSCEDHSGV